MGSWILSSSNSGGFWEPHTSSVDFCEPNYMFTDYIAEIHNVWSSVVICIFGLIGLFYCNITNEWRNIVMFLTIIIVGLGSVALHTTLHAFGQSTDEVPMLWANAVFLFNFITIKNAVGQSTRSLEFFTLLVAAFQAYLYYETRHIYWVFLVSYITPLVVVVFWTVKLVFFTDCKPEERKLRFYLWIRSVISYIFIASILWIYEMHHCENLLHLFHSIGGITFHILWHIGAGLGAYFQVLLMISIRAQHLGGAVEVRHLLGVFPIIALKSPLQKEVAKID